MDEQLLKCIPERSRELIRFACTRLQRSYKPVLMRIFIDALPRLTIPMREVTEKFTAFYLDREARGLPVESCHAPFIVGGRCDPARCAATAQSIVRVIFAAWHGYADVEGLSVNLLSSRRWLPLGEDPSKRIACELLSSALEEYYSRIVARGEAVYGPEAGRDEGATDVLVFDVPDTDEGDFLLVL